jgi:hypothetical protein
MKESEIYIKDDGDVVIENGNDSQIKSDNQQRKTKLMLREQKEIN